MEGKEVKRRKKMSGSDGAETLGAGGDWSTREAPGGRALQLLADFSLPTRSVVFTLYSFGGSW